MRLLTLVPLLLFLAGCGTGSVRPPETSGPAGPATEVFGADFSPEGAHPAERLLADYGPEQLRDTVAVTLVGEVHEVCQAKGCWMTVAAGDGEEMMVKFRDYGFFVPRDIGGRRVMMDGIAYYQITPAEELRHYAEDAGKPAAEVAAITEDRRELRFLARGVRLLPQGD